MKIKTLTITEAYDLYRIIRPAFPTVSEGSNVIDFLSDFMSNIRDINSYILVDCLRLFLGADEDTIIDMKQDEILSYLVAGFEQNQIISLMDFFNGMVDHVK